MLQRTAKGPKSKMPRSKPAKSEPAKSKSAKSKSAKSKPSKPPNKPEKTRTNDPERTRRDIVEVATVEFAAEGYSGARVDTIAAKTRTSKRMIYYYFGGKEQLYLAVLEEVGLLRCEWQWRSKFHFLELEPLRRASAVWLGAYLKKPNRKGSVSHAHRAHERAR